MSKNKGMWYPLDGWESPVDWDPKNFGRWSSTKKTAEEKKMDQKNKSTWACLFPDGHWELVWVGMYSNKQVDDAILRSDVVVQLRPLPVTVIKNRTGEIGKAKEELRAFLKNKPAVPTLELDSKPCYLCGSEPNAQHLSGCPKG